MAIGGGLTRRLSGTAVVRLDGRPPSRLQHALREAILWSVFIILAAGPTVVAYRLSPTEQLLKGSTITSVVLLLAYAALGTFTSRRMLHDALAGTTIVPR